ncbi:TIGR02117 family protein [Sphingomonas sp. BN140010]|uniref:TIGR02117 family protein n=1 Tax=Sphingomonas arvum TaxID=2992113 RepID=A0ABT3JBA2_9SPHN|nr:TIGR02117 family protein [Sphingomonas sp. BN140010]MCW3796348.1 TIGR02117 family protein [Sphingomonas sp. BN140010]
MARRRRRSRVTWPRRLLLAMLAVPALYLLAALVGSLVPLNGAWTEPARGTTVYLRSNGVHVDIVMPAVAQGLDWRSYFPRRDFADAPANPKWFGFGAGERRVFLETASWADLTPRAAWGAVAGGERIIHVDRTAEPGADLFAIRLRPEEYRRLWAAVRAQLALSPEGRPLRIDHPGYGPDDAFYLSRGRASALNTCNNWVADKLRLAGVEVSAWSPFAQGLTWRYRKVER